VQLKGKRKRRGRRDNFLRELRNRRSELTIKGKCKFGMRGEDMPQFCRTTRIMMLSKIVCPSKNYGNFQTTVVLVICMDVVQRI